MSSASGHSAPAAFGLVMVDVDFFVRQRVLDSSAIFTR